MIDIVAFLYRHCIDLGAKHHQRALFPALEDSRQTGATEFGHRMIRMMWLDELPQDPTGFGLLGRKLGLTMELMPERNQIGQIAYTVHGPSVRRLNNAVDTLSLFAIC
jgi:hypothetical protein